MLSTSITEPDVALGGKSAPMMAPAAAHDTGPWLGGGCSRTAKADPKNSGIRWIYECLSCSQNCGNRTVRTKAVTAIRVNAHAGTWLPTFKYGWSAMLTVVSILSASYQDKSPHACLTRIPRMSVHIHRQKWSPWRSSHGWRCGLVALRPGRAQLALVQLQLKSIGFSTIQQGTNAGSPYANMPTCVQSAGAPILVLNVGTGAAVAAPNPSFT